MSQGPSAHRHRARHERPPGRRRRAASLARLCVVAAALGCEPDEPRVFTSNVVFDTVASVGHVEQTNPLQIYESPTGVQFISDTMLLYADSRGGTLTAVNPETGVGWQVNDQGGDGPGEFGGATPWFTESGGTIFTVVPSRQASSRSLDGELLSAETYRELISDEPGFWGVAGLLSSGEVIGHSHETWDLARPGRQELPQAVTAYAYDGFSWRYDDLPPVIAQVREYEPDRGSGASMERPVTAHARHRTVLVTASGARWILALNGDGTVRRRVEIDTPVRTGFVDADERIWIWVKAPSEPGGAPYIVFDRELEVLDTVIAWRIQDARGDRIATFGIDRATDLMRIHVLERRR